MDVLIAKSKEKMVKHFYVEKYHRMINQGEYHNLGFSDSELQLLHDLQCYPKSDDSINIKVDEAFFAEVRQSVLKNYLIQHYKNKINNDDVAWIPSNPDYISVVYAPKPPSFLQRFVSFCCGKQKVI